MKNKKIMIKPFLDDQCNGKNWSVEPHTKENLQHAGANLHIDGCFCHIRFLCILQDGRPFEGFSCNHCRSIIKLPDFRMRLYRQEKAKDNRGYRGTVAKDWTTLQIMSLEWFHSLVKIK